MEATMAKSKNDLGSVFIVVFFLGIAFSFIACMLLASTYNNIVNQGSLEERVYRDFQAQNYKNIPKELKSDYENWKFKEKRSKTIEKMNGDT